MNLEHKSTFNLDKKLIFFGVGISVFAIGISGFLSFNSAEDVLIERANDQLISESTIRGNTVGNLFFTRIKETQILTTDPMIQILVEELNQKNILTDSQIEENNRAFLTEVKAFQQLVGFSIGFEDVQIIGNDGTLHFSLVKSKEDDFSQKSIFSRGLIAPFVTFEPSADAKKMVVVSPIFSRDASGPADAIGVLIAKMRTAEFDEILLSRSGLGETGEVYVVNEDHLMLSESRFIQNTIFNQKIETLPVIECFDTGNNINELYQNYRDSSIYGSSYCAKDLGFVLIAEVDEGEVLQPVVLLQERILEIGLIVTIGMGVIALLLSKTISRPLIKLKNAANEISEGNFSVRTNIMTKDEIGQLSSSFDLMAKRLQESEITIKQKEEVIKQQEEVLLQFSEQSESYFVSFVDIIQSTKITAGLTDLQAQKFYSIFINNIADIVRMYNGIVVKNIGDALLFYFPKTNTKDQEELKNAIECCVKIGESYPEIHKKLADEGLPKLNYRVSASYGPVSVAKVATSSVEDIFGSTVNRCSKINRFAKSNGVVIGSDLVEIIESLKEYDVEDVTPTKRATENIFSVFSVSRKSADKISFEDIVKKKAPKISKKFRAK